MIVFQVPFAQLWGAPNIGEMLNEYAAESALDGMPKPIPHLDSYLLLVKANLLTTICAFQDEKIVGFLLLLVNTLPHYSVPIATIESFFVKKEHRATGAGLKLLSCAGDIAKGKGAAGMLISAAVNSDFDRLMSALMLYKKTHNTYFRSFA
tara:strand:+ start:181 stop:633 length:453 start_codon:yes stop_codon:yes gene_type:complete